MSSMQDRAAERLPLTSRKRLTDLRQEHSELRAINRSISDDLAKARERCLNAKQEIARLTDRGNGFAPLKNDHAIVRALEDDAAKEGGEVKRLSELFEVRHLRLEELAALIEHLDRWITDLPREVALAQFQGPAPEPRKGETRDGAIDRCRRRVREIRADKLNIEARPLPSKIVKAKSRAHFEALAARGRPDVFNAVESGGVIIWPETTTRDIVYGGEQTALSAITMPDMMAIFAWLHRDALIAAVDREIDQAADDANALDDVQRATRLAELVADMLAVEREEEFWIGQLKDSGMSFPRRVDANPCAVLDLAVPAMTAL